MKSKILTALLMLFPFMQLTAFIDEEDGETVDQFLLTIGTSGYMLWQAVELAHENGFRYVKILSAEYKVGNQAGGFTNQTEEDKEGALLSFEDDLCKMTVSAFHFMPNDTDYIDTEDYQDLLNDDEDDDDTSSDEDDFDDDNWY